MTTLAYSHTLVAGTPENINDVQDMFNDARTVINGNLDATNLAASAKPATLMGAYRTVAQGSFLFSNSTTAASYYPSAEGGTITATAVAVATSGTPVLIPITLADYTVSGLTTQFRVQATTITNATASATTFTYSLAQVTAVAGGANLITISTVNNIGTSNVARAAPAASSIFADTSSDFTVSTNGSYALIVTLAGTPAASSRVVATLSLQVHNI